MAANQHTGEVSVKLKGKSFTICFDWHALSDLHNSFPDDLSAGLMDVGKVSDPLKLAKILAIGLKKFHPEMTNEVVLEMSPALVPCKKPLDDALALAYFGADLMKGIIGAKKAGKKKATKKKKKT